MTINTSLRNSAENLVAKNFSEKKEAEFLGISKITLQRKRKAGEINFYQIGSRILYHPDHLAAYLAKCEQKAGR